MEKRLPVAAAEASAQSGLLWMGLLSMAAGMLHGIASTDYWSNRWVYAAFFLLVALSQGAAGLLLLFQPWRYDETGGLRAGWLDNLRWFFLAGVIFNGGIILLWLASRTIGLPTPEGAAEVLPVTALSAVTTVIELGIVFTLVRYLRWIDGQRQAA